MRSVLRTGAAALTLVFLAGCASTRHPISASFDGLTNEAVSTRAGMFDYRTFVSVSGLAPSHVAGTLEHAPRGLSPSHAIGISPKWSYVVQNDYEVKDEKGAAAAVASVKGLYLAASRHAAEVAAIQAEMLTVSLRHQALDKPEAKQTLLESAAQLLGKSCAAAACSAGEIEQAKTNAQTKLADLQQKLGAAQKSLTDTNERITSALSRNNIIVTRWDASNAASANAEVSSFANAGADYRNAQSGIAIFGGLRTLKLYAGEDFIDMLQTHSAATSAGMTEVGITTFAVLAKEVEYISDQDLQASAVAGASLSAAQLANVELLLETLKRSSTVSFDAGFRSGAILGNSGKLSAPTTDVLEYSFYPPAAYSEFLKAQTRKNSGYATVFAVRATVPRVVLLGTTADMWKTDLTDAWAKEGKDGALTKWQRRCMDALRPQLKPEEASRVEAACTVPPADPSPKKK